MGGASAERDVSLASGLRVAQALRERGHEVTSMDAALGVIDLTAETRMREAGVKEAPPSLDALQRLSLSATLADDRAIRDADVVFLALHGGQGEDGTVQALLDLAGVTYTGSGPLASALAMDKDLSKTLFRAAGVNTAPWLMTPGGANPPSVSIQDVERTLALPVVVKPSKQGSTVGLSVVKRHAELGPAIIEAAKYDDEIMIERFIPGREFTVAVLGGQALPVGEIIPTHEIYDYECKYTKGMAREEFPAQLSAEATHDIQRQALLAFRSLKLGGYARVDFRMSDDGVFQCLEANTLPGMTELSLVPQAAAAHGLSFPELCERIVQLAMSKPPLAERAR